MRKLLLPILFFAVLSSNSFSQNLTPSATPTSVVLSSMHLVAPDTGWAASDFALFWTTTDGKQWIEITPNSPDDRKVASVFFLDASIGWVLFSDWNREANATRFDIASTTNGGTSWSVHRVELPPRNPLAEFSPGGAIRFVSASHGWMSVPLTGSSAAHPGWLLETLDGGNTWKWNKSPTFPGSSGLILFVNAQQGWLLSTGRAALYATYDGARTWKEVSLKAPPAIGASIYPTYELPIFKDAQHGFLPIMFSGPEGSKSALVLFATADGGQNWEPKKIVTGLGQSWVGELFPSTLADSTLIIALGGRTQLTFLRAGPATQSTWTTGTFGAPVLGLDFVNGSRGWALLTDGHLQSTSDGGATWVSITPKAHRQSTVRVRQ